ncbi:nucleotide kinase domain-containing protein [Curtobacterium luteum]|uniref:nucleotide kinase domain-containing protein n=1 Tax=Curtobacterium luteum TaxID=33881 RepID=UPI0038028787
MRAPQPRQAAFDIFWRFAAERHRIFEARAAGIPGPWTTDPILSTFKFCNVYRAADRVSQHLIREVAYADDVNVDAADLAFQIVAFRTFSNISTWQQLRADLGRAPTLRDLESGAFEAALTRMRDRQQRIYTGAFILCATDAYRRKIKHLNHVELFKDMFLRNRLGDTISSLPTMRAVYDTLHRFPLMGDFMSYQIAVDLNYSTLTDFSENEFTQPGPGAVRGIKKVFQHTGSLSPADTIKWMVDRQEEEFAARGLAFNGLWGRPIQAIDAQNLFCETDKYCREALPELASARTRIKARYVHSAALPELFFPPKWGINARLPHTTRQLVAA